MRMIRALPVVVFALALWPAAPVRGQEDAWADLRFLIGSWVSEGKPESGSGSFTLEPDLQGKILVRKNIAHLPAAKGRPAGTHEDLMVVYRDPRGKQLRASYFDSEGHVIQYAVNPSPDRKSIVFLSDRDPAGPRFRLTYTKGEGDKIAIKFEIAPPGKTEEFKTYLEGTVRRKEAAKK